MPPLPPRALLHAPILAIGLCALAGPSPGRAWSAPGHEIVGALAEERLTPAARRLVEEALGPRRLSDRGVATWADRERTRSTAPWHYVNVPTSADGYLAARDCPRRGCAVSAIEEAAARLRGAGDRDALTEPLLWLVHLVADLHQPMHAGDLRDRGGNEIEVRLGRRRQPLNAHRLWDRHVVEPLLRASDPRRAGRALASTLDPGEAAAWEGALDPAAWATESHLVAREIYAELRAYPVSGGRILLPPGYPEAQRTRTSRALARAGVRLAALLDRIALEREARRALR